MPYDGLNWVQQRRPQGHFESLEYCRDGGPNPPIPSQPLKSQPGTIQRIRDLEQRAARGEHLWHPDDPASLVGFEGDLFSESIFGNGPRHGSTTDRARGRSRRA